MASILGFLPEAVILTALSAMNLVGVYLNYQVGQQLISWARRIRVDLDDMMDTLHPDVPPGVAHQEPVPTVS